MNPIFLINLLIPILAVPFLDDSYRIGGRALDSVASSSSACVRRVCSALLSCRSHFLTRSSQLTHSSLSDEQTPQHTWCKSALTLTSPIPSPDPRLTNTSSLRSLRQHNLISINSAVQNFIVFLGLLQLDLTAYRWSRTRKNDSKSRATCCR